MELDGLGTGEISEALATAKEFASRFKRKGVVGIVFLGAIARGYFDKFSDIDVIIFKRRKHRFRLKYQAEIEYKGFRIDYEIVNYEDSARSEWDMEKRWAFSNALIYYDPESKIRQLISDKVPLKSKERKWMIIEGMIQSEWYCNIVSESWVYRGDVVSAHYSINAALEELLNAVFAINKELFPPKKWRIRQSFHLRWLPKEFRAKLEQIMQVKALSTKELKRRRAALNYLWEQVLPRAEEEVGMRFGEFKTMV